MTGIDHALKKIYPFAAGLLLLLPSAHAQVPEDVKKILLVPSDIGDETVVSRKQAQLDSMDQFDSFLFFQFFDRQKDSGIAFRHQIVDDAGKHYKMVHYDHGNGLAVADVDGDNLPDIYFLSQVGANELWRNLGGGRFENITAKSGLGLADRISVAGSFADIDNDGDPDLFVSTVQMGNFLFENEGGGMFRDISKSAGVDYSGHSSGAVFFDYDRDGLLDLFVTNVGTYTTSERGRAGYYVGIEEAFSGHLHEDRTEASILYRNVGGNRFADVSADVGLVDTGWSGDATAVDVNQDGFLDLYVLNMQGDDHLYLNDKGQSFSEVTADYFPKTPWGAMGVKFFDFDNDANLDLIITDMHSDMSELVEADREKLKARMQWTEDHLQGGANNLFGNAFYRGLGKGRFEEMSDPLGTENYWPWGLSVGDLNADGFEDVFITASMNYPFRYGLNSLLLNNRGQRFFDSEFILGVEPRQNGSLTTDWFTLDCSGADNAHSHCEEGDNMVSVRAAKGSRSSAIFDLDGDGDLDIVTNEFNDPPQVLLSDLSDQKEISFLAIRLVGNQSNRDGLGALVTVVAGEDRFTKPHDGKSGYLSQSSLPLYFGLGDHRSIDRIEVVWPSGHRQEVSTGIQLNSLLEITEENNAS
jgi:hypothetical protein